MTTPISYFGILPQGMNFSALDAQVRVAFPTITGTSQDNLTFTVFFSDTPANLAQVESQLDAIFAAHDPTQKTAQQTQDATADTAAANLRAQAITEAQFWETLTAGSITTIPQAVALIVRLGKVCAAIIRMLLRKGLV